MNKLLIIFFGMCFLTSCAKKDEEKIIGKWQNEEDWFEYHQDKTYNAGKSFIVMVKNFKYSIDPSLKQLTMYTDENSKSYYLIYEFHGDDTLAVRNSMSSNKTMIEFYRLKE